MYKYDLFISYSRQDGAWMKREIYKRLQSCVKGDGTRPIIFLDVSGTGVNPSGNFMKEIPEAIQESRRVLAIYSTRYFESDMTLFELRITAGLDPAGQDGKLVPILIEPDAESMVPLGINLINWLDIEKQPDWFERLLKLLHFEQAEPAELKFAQAPIAGQVNITLPPVVVEVASSGTDTTGLKVELTAEGAPLGGTLVLPLENDRAVFDDLTIGQPAELVRITARAEGCLTAVSSPFAVSSPVAAPAARQENAAASRDVILPHPPSCRVEFFADSGGVAVFCDDAVHTYDKAGKPMGSLPLPGPVRFIRSRGSVMVAGQWDGGVALLTSQGQLKHFDFSTDKSPYNITGGCTFSEEGVMVGLWCGEVRLLSHQGGEPGLIASHPAGIQDISLVGNDLYMVDQDGVLHLYREGKPVWRQEVEIGILGTRFVDGPEPVLIIIGETHGHQLALSRGGGLASEPLGLARARHMKSASRHFLVLDGNGKGCWLDDSLLSRRFQTQSGARPRSIDEKGRYAAFQFLTGDHVLMKERNFIFTSSQGEFAFSPDLSLVALATGNGLQLLGRDFFDAFSEDAEK